MSFSRPQMAQARPSYDPMPPERTSSPTPSELEDNDETPFGFKSLMHTRGKQRSPWATIALIAVGIIFIVIMILQNKIISAIQPVAKDLRDLTCGWLIPIAILIVLSFPPLFGHEIIAIMVGVVWGIWKGFAIVAAGTLLGEIANWFVFKYFCTGRAKKHEAKQLAYACLSRVVREGGFWVVLVIRFSAIPGHFSTVVFSVSGISFWVYLLAAVLSLPKQIVTVYVGVAAQQKNESTGSKILSYVIIAVTIIVTVVAARWTFKKMDAVRPEVVAERRAARALKREKQFTEAMNNGAHDDSSTVGHTIDVQPNVPLLSAPGYTPVGGRASRPSSDDGYEPYNLSTTSLAQPYDPPQRSYSPQPPPMSYSQPIYDPSAYSRPSNPPPQS